jgi:heat shock protein HslJ
VSIQPAGQALQPAPNGVPYQLTAGDNRVSTKADCNTCGGGLAINGTAVTIGPLLACTRAACSTMAYENAYVTLLTGESTVQVDGNSLTLSSPRGVLRFSR